MHLTKLFKTYRKVKDIFVRPSLRFYFGKWENDPNLPIYRSGPQIWLIKRKNLSKYCYVTKDTQLIKVGEKACTSEHFGNYSIPVYTQSYHKLPKGILGTQHVFKKQIRNKLKKWGINLVTPYITLPRWMRFRIINWDVMYKHKWNEVRYEFPPQFSIVFFGLSLTITAHAPKINDANSLDDHYWESVINAAEKINCGPEEALKYAMEQGGFWYTPTNKPGYFSLRPDYIKDKYRALYNKELYRVANKVEEDVQ